ncbi:LTA synthase family protein [Candidatus Xianfuyuplasma coldseepsis]|uniref:LTA synthase family protein n=1 Tax=Candidatus Xianfuyuplasma coldseepsis TaxID=2782163 RepID=A0A7L7KSL5_9MOLU|nr:LTA synthase family protein [Xianfuyuplasma coldseepsis]QMS85733.1 LTA synthase family protein [Xianfuyuplasma coldseepsis]
MTHIKNYKSYMYVIAYLMLLRVVLLFTVGMDLRPMGLLYDLVVMMFWVGMIAYFISNITGLKVYYIFVVLFGTVFAIVDSVYFDYFGVIFARSSASGIKWLQEGNTLEYNIQIPLVTYLITPLLIGVIYLIITNKKKDVFRFKEMAVLATIFVLQVGLFLFWGNQSFDTKLDYYRSDAFLFETMHDRILYSEKYGYYNYHLLDLTRIRPKADPAAMVQEVDEYFASLPNHTTNDYSDIYSGYNVINIVGETLETRFIDETLTPHLYLMQQNGMVFDNYFTTVFQQGATCNSEYMSITGLSAITTNDWSSNICDAYSENIYPYSMPSQLRDQGYNTYYFHSGYEWFYNRKTMIPNYGYETVKFQEDIYNLGYTEDDFYDRFDTDMMLFVDEYLKYDQPFLMTLLTYSMHGAYNQEEFEIHRDQLDAAYPDNEFDPEIENYMLKLIEFDTLIGDLMDKLDEEGELDNTLFVVYPDHYPYMMNYDTYTEYIDVIDDFHEVMRQELIIYATDMTGDVIHTTGSQIDVTPTIMNMINSSSNFRYFMGTDLLSTDENYVIFADLVITDGTNTLYLDESVEGDDDQLSTLEQALMDRITMLEIQKDLLNSDYFAYKEEFE